MLRAATGSRPSGGPLTEICTPSRRPNGQLQAHEFVDARSVPIIDDEKIEGTTKGSKATREPRLEIVLGGGLMHGLARDRLNDGNQVLDAMAELIRDDA